jgi:hypothetical protein
MVQKVSKSASALDIASLLDLLNNSEADGISDTLPAAEPASASPDPTETSSLPEIISTMAEPVDLSVNPENSDNRFAAHIIFGLSKLKRS